MEPSLDWVSLPPTRFAGAADQPRAPAPTMLSWPPPPASGSAPPPPLAHETEDEEVVDADQ